jgi:hypothetical protein
MTNARSALPDRDPTAAPTLRDASKVVGWGLVFWGAAQLAVAVFARNATALVAVQAVLAEWGAGRIGIAWSDPLAPMPSWKDLGRRVAKGAGLGAVAAIAIVVVAMATQSAARAAGSPGGGLLAVGLVIALLGAVRDELLLRGVVLRATRGLLPGWAALLVCGGAAAAARFGVDGTLGMALAVEALRGTVLGAIWTRDRGAWMAVGANAAWTWTLGSVVRGGVVDIRFATEPEAGVPALAVLLAATVAALSATRQRLPPGERGESSE